MSVAEFRPEPAAIDALRRFIRDRDFAAEEPGPSAALAAVEPSLARFGITRVGDLTGLDTVGIPVWFACRPNSRALSVSQGKGLDDAEARLSAIMEAVETAAAERTRGLIEGFASIAAMERLGLPTLPLAAIRRAAPARLDPDRERAWVSALSVRTGERVFVPYELAGLDMRVDMPWDHAGFSMSSVGLAAGLGWARPVLHAVLELVENDATAPLEPFGPARALLRPLAHRQGESRALDGLVERIGAAGLAVRFADCTRDVPIPVVAAFVDWPDATRGATGTRWCAGFACRPDPCDAAIAALLEAVQSRLTNIAGARDDIVPRDYAASSRRRFAAPTTAASIGSLAARRFAAGAEPAGQRLAAVLDTIFDAGVADVFLVPLGVEAAGIRVVRAIATTLEALSPHRPAAIGPQALGLPLLAAAGHR